MSTPQLPALAAAERAALTDFVCRLVQTPSLPGQESKVAGLVAQEMQRLGYDEVTTDAVGNVIGVVRGQAGGAGLLFDGHIDQVDAGAAAGWPYPPFSGQVVDGEIWGRGSVDMKGPLAAMIYAGGLVKKAGLQPPGDLIVAAVVLEEKGGLGTRTLVQHVHPGLAVIGEPSAGRLMRGHRGRIELEVRFGGRSIHASIPDQGVNPHYAAARFLCRLEDMPMDRHPVFGPASVAPTLYRTDQTSANVTPGEVVLTLDWRSLPHQTAAGIVHQLEQLPAADLEPEATCHVQLASYHLSTYTGVEEDWPALFPSFELPPDAPLVQQARQVLSRALDEPVPVDVWRFATDGGHTMAAGIPTIGFGPGDPTLAHTNRERIAIDALLRGLTGYAALAVDLPRNL